SRTGVDVGGDSSRERISEFPGDLLRPDAGDPRNRRRSAHGPPRERLFRRAPPAARLMRGAWRVTRSAIAVAGLLALGGLTSPLRAQDKLRAQREELDRIRQERADLERKMLELRA